MKNRKNLGLIVIAFVCGCLFMSAIPASAKSKFGFTETDKFNIWSIRMTDRVSDWVDDETGVHYLAIFDDESLNALCPRYNSDGEIMVDKDFKKIK